MHLRLIFGTYGKVAVVCCNSAENEIERHFGEGCDHDYGFKEIANGARKRTIMDDWATGNHTRLE